MSVYAGTQNIIIYKKCPICMGNGAIVCGTCSGSGKIKIYNSFNNGYHIEKCFKCNGTGYFEKCYYCGGSGKIKTDSILINKD